MVKTHQLLKAPSPRTTIKPWTYTDDQLLLIDALHEYAQDIMLPEHDSYHVWERRWLERADTIPRYMRAAKWRLEDAKKRIRMTLEWRREYQPDLIPPDEVEIECQTGKIFLNGFDCDGRPVVYMRPGLENTPQSPRQLRHLVWCLERAKDLQPLGVENITIIVDYKTTTLRTNPSVSIARKVLHILQAHYPETLGRGLVVNLPTILAFFYRAIAPFMDPVTRDKIRFNPNLPELIPLEQLDADFGGDYEFEFEPKSYWEQIIEMCHITSDGTRVAVTEEEMPSGAAKGPLSQEILASDSATLSKSSSMTAVETQDNVVRLKRNVVELGDEQEIVVESL